MAHENLIKTLDYYGEKIVKEMKRVLIKNKKRATGNLINSIDYDIVINRKGFGIEYEYAPYGNLVSGRPSPTWKRGKGPPVQAIRNWLIAKNIPFKQTNGKKLSRKERLDAMTYSIIRKIKIRKKLNPLYNNPTDFLKVAEDGQIFGSTRWKKDIGMAIKKDAMAFLKK